jgi:L-fuculose-phosphate aldolase
VSAAVQRAGDHEQQAREDLARVSKALYAAGYITSTDGNLSVRLPAEGAGAERFVCTPSGSIKGRLAPADMLVVALDGTKLAGTGKVTTEWPLHAQWYRDRPDVGAVVHAHPAMCVALTLAGVTLEAPLMPEMLLALGRVPTAPYATPGTDELPKSMRPYTRAHNVVLMQSHGAVTVGRTLDEAFFRLERVEWTAKVVHAARLLGPVTPLSPEAVAALRSVALAAGIHPEALPPMSPSGQNNR